LNPIADAYLWACNCELDALKPGNVHRHSAGHGMSVADFELSASVSAPAVARLGAPVGARIYDAVAVTKKHVGKNTNLGIILLCAPLAAAVEQNKSIAQVLTALDLSDAQCCYDAIVLAQPGGLGASPQHDVGAPATTHLLKAMQIAADRDLIARQYSNNFADIFGLGMSRWLTATENGATPAQAASDVYLAFLAQWPDTHIVRKFGQEVGEAVREEAQLQLAAVGLRESERLALLQEWDSDLKARGLNPGACADLTVATLFTARLMDIVPNGLRLFLKSG
jgi:triphosphoribosyl-dephospho-CoA synthase